MMNKVLETLFIRVGIKAHSGLIDGIWVTVTNKQALFSLKHEKTIS